MNKVLLLGLFLFSFLLYAQPNTDVYLFDLTITNGKPVLSNPKNISNNEGYDNQPSFLDNSTILFSSTRDEQTDIRRLDIEDGSVTKWITDTPTGSEYSPLKIPEKEAVSAIRLDLDGLQRLYEYDIKTGESKPILKDLKVGYHLWFTADILVVTVLVENRMDLVVSNLKDGTNTTVQRNVGRSLHKIPNTNLISFVSKEKNLWEIKSLDLISGVTKKIVDTYNNTEDMCWLNNGTILAGSGKSILSINPKNDFQWLPVQNFKQEEINNISRIAVSENSKRLAFVAEESPAVIVQKQLDAYNARDINAFMDTYSQNVKLFNYPEKLLSEGQDKMKASYKSYFEGTPDLHCEIKNRIVIGNKVIDQEYITAKGTNFNAVAIYEVQNGKIFKVTFIQ